MNSRAPDSVVSLPDDYGLNPVLAWVLFASVTVAGALYLAGVFGIAGPPSLRAAATGRLRQMSTPRWLIWSAGSAAFVAFWVLLVAPPAIPHRRQVLGWLLVIALFGVMAALVRPRRRS